MRFPHLLRSLSCAETVLPGGPIVLRQNLSYAQAGRLGMARHTNSRPAGISALAMSADRAEDESSGVAERLPCLFIDDDVTESWLVTRACNDTNHVVTASRCSTRQGSESFVGHSRVRLKYLARLQNWASRAILFVQLIASRASRAKAVPRTAPFLASLLIRHGESVKTVQSRLGTASAVETLDTYSHLWPDSDDRTRVAIDSVLAAESAADVLRTEAAPI